MEGNWINELPTPALFPRLILYPLCTLLLGFTVILCVARNKIVYMTRNITVALFLSLWNKVTGTRKLCPRSTGPNQRLKSFIIVIMLYLHDFSLQGGALARVKEKKIQHTASSLERVENK